MKNIRTYLFILGWAFCSIYCKKYLDKKPDKSLAVPATVKDLQALLDNTTFNNERSPSWDEASSDGYYLSAEDYNSLATYEQKAYLWEDYNHQTYPNDWSIIYDAIYYSNVVLEGAEKISSNDQIKAELDNVKGSALFLRAQSFLRAASIFCKAYDLLSARQEYGIVLKVTSDFNEKSVRANLEDTYKKITEDLKDAAKLLPTIPKHVMRPSAPAAYAVLARTYLAMQQFDSSFRYADLCLQLKNDLMDYNTDVDPNNLFAPIPQFNKEIIYSSVISTYLYSSILPYYARIDTTLYNLYSNDDIRKQAFFLDATEIGSNGHLFQGTYDGSFSNFFIGVATDEVWLTRAECNARLGRKDAALIDLNRLLKTRWKVGTFIPFSAPSAEMALDTILNERRKELLFRGTRWMDIKRLNKLGANIYLKRYMNGTEYILPPNDNRFALLLPSDIVNITGMYQNGR